MSKKKKYPMRHPRATTGIRAQELRASTGRVWWAKRWIERLETMGLGARLGRGKNYAMSGQVIDIQMNLSKVTAKVLGVRPKPYLVEINFRTPSGEARDNILKRLKDEPMLLARLLADELPMEIEGFFKDEGYDFFPGGQIESLPEDPPNTRRYDMMTSCSCPDYANPCKHSCAVLFLLGEEIARHPFTLLELRGFSMEELCDEE